MSGVIFKDHEADRRVKTKWWASRTVREEFLKRFWNSTVIAISASLLAVILGSLAAYGLSRFNYRFGFMRNSDISFFFLSQMILPPVVLALPFLVLYKSLNLLDNQVGLILLYTLMVLPIVIWIMRDQFQGIPIELEEAALVDGLGIWGAFIQIVLPIALPGMVAAFILSLVLCWNEYFFAALLTATNATTLPVMVASQTGSQGINWWSMAALSSAAIPRHSLRRDQQNVIRKICDRRIRRGRQKHDLSPCFSSNPHEGCDRRKLSRTRRHDKEIPVPQRWRVHIRHHHRMAAKMVQPHGKTSGFHLAISERSTSPTARAAKNASP